MSFVSTKYTLFTLMVLLSLVGISQSITQYSELTYGSEIPEELTSSRTAIFIDLFPISKGGFIRSPEWKKFSKTAHQYIYKMGIDAVFYINQIDFTSGNSTKSAYLNLLTERGIRNLIFINQVSEGYELICTKVNSEDTMIKNGQSAFRIQEKTLESLMLNLARSIKRSGILQQNFLVPEKPQYIEDVTIAEKLTMKNYPGQVRRSVMTVEKFGKLPVPKTGSDELKTNIESHNLKIEQMNQELESIVNQEFVKAVKELPYEVKFVDHMSDDDLIRNRYQFSLRNVNASGEAVRSQLNYEKQMSNAGYVSVIPIIPDNSTIKTIPKDALVYKFYIRQNIAKNIYVGDWDSDITWQDALRNYLRNMIQFFNKGN